MAEIPSRGKARVESFDDPVGPVREQQGGMMEGIDIEALRTLLDRHAILDCITRYARGMDRVDEELARSAYHPDAIDDHGTGVGNFVGNVDEFLEWAWGRQETHLASQHYLTNHSLDIDGDTAHAESYFLAMLRHGEPEQIRLGGGRYLDRLERRDGEWRIAARVVVGEWTTVVEPVPAAEAPAHPGRRDRTDLSYARPLQTRTPEPAPAIAS
jgi:hypothetical protein